MEIIVADRIITSVFFVIFGVLKTKVDKSDFKDHCKDAREDKKEMYKTLSNMSNKVTEIHTIVKERHK